MTPTTTSHLLPLGDEPPDEKVKQKGGVPVSPPCHARIGDAKTLVDVS